MSRQGPSAPGFALPVSPPWGVGRGGGAVAMPPQLSGQVPAGPPSLQIPLPEVLPIPDAREFNPLGSIGSAAVTANPTLITGTSFNVPDSCLAVIRSVTLYITNMLTTTNVTWSLMVNQTSPQGFNNITIFPRATPFVSNGFDSMIRIDGPAVISVVFNNIDGGAYTIGASFSGWFWPEASDARWRQFGR